MIVLDKMIRVRRLTEFVQEVLRIRNQEMIDKARWEVWLHRIVDMDFKEYLAACDGTTEEVLSEDVMEATVRESMEIINGFCPS